MPCQILIASVLYAQNKSFVNFVTEKFSCLARGGKLRAKVNRSWWQYITHCTAMNNNTSHTVRQWTTIHHTLYGNEQSYFWRRQHTPNWTHYISKCTSPTTLVISSNKSRATASSRVRLFSQLRQKVVQWFPSHLVICSNTLHTQLTETDTPRDLFGNQTTSTYITNITN